MKMFFAMIGLVMSVAFPASATDVAYVDATGCIHTPILTSAGKAAYWNLDANTCKGDLFTSMSALETWDDTDGIDPNS